MWNLCAVVTHFPGAQICERYGGKWTLAFSILFGAIFTIATPLTVEYAGFTALLVRIIYGFTSGVIFPAVSVLLAAWVPEKERTKLGTLTLSGSPIASLLSFYLSGSLLSYWQWPIVFYFWGVLSITWFILFVSQKTIRYSQYFRFYFKISIQKLFFRF